MMTATAYLQKIGDSYIAWIPDQPGMVVEGSTPEEAQRELLTSLRVKIAYDNKLDISSIDFGEAPRVQQVSSNPDCDAEAFQLQLA